MQTFGEALRRARRHAGMSQNRLAALTNFTASYLSKVESGEKAGSRDLAVRCDRALGADGELIAAYEQVAEARATDDLAGGNVQDVHRRTFISIGTKTAVGVAALAGIDMADGQPTVTAADVTRLGQVITRLRALDQQHGSADLWDVAADRAHGIAALLEHARYSDDVGAQLVELTGRAYMAAGWLATDAGRHDQAHGFYTEALSYADQADNPEIRVHALLNLALHAQIQRRPRQMLRYVDAAERALPAEPPGRAPAVVLMRRGRALAMLGERDESARAFGAARETFDRDTRPPATWLPWFGHAEIDAVEGEAALDQSTPGRGANLLERALGVYEARFARNRALHLVRLSRARATAGQVDGAAESTHAALDLLDGEVASVRVGAELRVLAEQLHPHRKVPAVGDSLARYRETPYAAPA
jgi:transcriptional regulator with XRE-family HTH domain